MMATDKDQSQKFTLSLWLRWAKKFNMKIPQPWPELCYGVGMVLCKILEQYITLYQIWIWSANNEGGGGGGGVSTGKISATMLLYLWFHLIWWPCSESWILTFWPHPLSLPRGSHPGLRSKIIFHIYCIYVCMQNFSKIYWQLIELLQNLNIWPLTPPKGSGGGVTF